MKKYFIFLITILSIFITRAYAYTDFNKYANFDYANFDDSRSLTYTSLTFKTLYENITSIEQDKYNISIIYGSYNSNWTARIFLFDKSITSVNSQFFSTSSSFGYFSFDVISYQPYYISFSEVDVSNNSKYNELIQCLNNNDCSFLSPLSRTISFHTTSYYDQQNLTVYGCLYYSDIPWILTLPDDASSSSRYYNSIKVDDTLVDFGTQFPTYITSPDEPVIPDEPEYVGNTIDNYVYWFYERDDEIGVLVNLYILLFFYCFISLTLKFLNIIKHTYY